MPLSTSTAVGHLDREQKAGLSAEQPRKHLFDYWQSSEHHYSFLEMQRWPLRLARLQAVELLETECPD
jgi:hypothetical protein